MDALQSSRIKSPSNSNFSTLESIESSTDFNSSASSSVIPSMAQQPTEVVQSLSKPLQETDHLQQSPSIPIRNKEPLVSSQADDRPSTTQEGSSSISGSSNWKIDPAPNRPPIKPSNFRVRDDNAILYTKSLLNQGDTLVIVRFPNNVPVYDTTGFQLSDTHRVNSHKLKAASPIFKKALEDDWQQHRFKRRNKLLGCLPPGIVYVLDLTPPDEGDDALELTALLSCSLGIRRWFKSEFSGIAAAHGLVGGQDETTVHPDDLKAQEAPATEKEHDTNKADTYMKNDGIYGRAFTDGNTDATLEQKIRESNARCTQPANQQSGNTQQESEYTKTHIDITKDLEILDYCPIRHRTGIERLLQIIEGKDPRLDSAPKVWTLAVLAAHFECANSVVDYIITWMIAEPNCKIFEILPEDCLRIGLMLQNEVATGYAFTILVSEEALRVGTVRSYPGNQPNANFAAGKQFTKFGRARESLDEDTLNLIQHAGRNFHARIEEQITNLMSPNMNWLFDLPEFTKILKIRDFMEANAATCFRLRDIKNTKTLMNELVAYVRGRLLWCFYQPLDASERHIWKEHRAQEQNLRGQGVSISDDVHNELGEHEKILTRSFWSQLRMLKWVLGDQTCATNLIRDEVWPRSAANTVLDSRARAAADSQGIEKVFQKSLESSADAVNKIILRAIGDARFNEGRFPDECFLIEQVVSQTGEPGLWSAKGAKSYDMYEYQRAQKTDYWKVRAEANTLISTSSSASSVVPASLPFPLLECPEQRISEAKKLAFWQEALRATDEAIARASSEAEFSPEIKAEDSDNVSNSWEEEYLILDKDTWEPDSSYDKSQEGYSPSWAKLRGVWNEQQESKNLPTARALSDPLRNGQDHTRNEDVFQSNHPSTSPSSTRNAILAHKVATSESTSFPHIPLSKNITPKSPFISLPQLFSQISNHIFVLTTRTLSRGSIQDVRPPTCDISDTLLCLSDEEYKYLPLWAGGLNDGSGGVFEDPIPPAERGGAMGPGPVYRTGSTAANSLVSGESGFGFESVGGSERWGGSEDDSVMGGVNTSVGVEDGFSISHIDRRRVVSEAEFLTPSSSETGSVVFVGGDEEEEDGDVEMEMDLPIRERGKGRAVDDDDDFVEMLTSDTKNQLRGFGEISVKEQELYTGKERAINNTDDAWDGDNYLRSLGINHKEQKALLSMYTNTSNEGQGKAGRDIDEQMSDIQSINRVAGTGTSMGTSVGDEDDANFFNTAGDDDGDKEFEFESDDGEDTGTEEEF
ncbi:hypothetical protein WAI453_010984 [Rhynchosporium graminicola]